MKSKEVILLGDRKIAEGPEVWVVRRNTDTTEGRGRLEVFAVCEIEAAALRVAEGADVQGSNAQVTRETSFLVGRTLYAPVKLESSGKGDEARQRELDALREAEKRARAAGVSDEDLATLLGRER